MVNILTNNQIEELKTELEFELMDSNPAAQSSLTIGDGLALCDSVREARQAMTEATELIKKVNDQLADSIKKEN